MPWAIGDLMILTYDLEKNAAYLLLREKTGLVETIRIRDELNVEVAPDGTVCGIEFLKANQQLGGEQGRLVVVDEASTQKREVRLGISRERQATPLWQLKVRGTPLSKQQQTVLRLCEQNGLAYKEVGVRLGLQSGHVQQIHARAKQILEDYAQNGRDALSLLPARIRSALVNWAGVESGEQLRRAIDTRELRWNEDQKQITYKRSTLRNLGWESWLALQDWMSNKRGRRRKPAGESGNAEVVDDCPEERQAES